MCFGKSGLPKNGVVVFPYWLCKSDLITAIRTHSLLDNVVSAEMIHLTWKPKTFQGMWKAIVDYCSPYWYQAGISQMSHKRSIDGCFRWVFVHNAVFSEQAGVFYYRHDCALSCLIASGAPVFHAHKVKKHLWLLCESLHLVI